MADLAGTQVDVELAVPPALRVVFIGFMGAGKSTTARQVATDSGCVFFDSDDRVLERLGASDVTTAFFEHGEEGFRAAERDVIVERAGLARYGTEVWALGGGAVRHDEVREILTGPGIHVIWLDVPVELAWKRVEGTDRPLARDRDAFAALLDARRATYEELAHERVAVDARLGTRLQGVEAELRKRGGVLVGEGWLARVAELEQFSVESVQVAIVADAAVAGLADTAAAALAAGGVDVVSHRTVPGGEWSKQLASVEQLVGQWLTDGVHRRVHVLAFGGGAALDTVGMAAAIYNRGLSWTAVPTTLTAQVDAAIGGKTAVNVGAVKNPVGAFHLPRSVVVDPAALATLPDDYLRDGFVEAIKTGLLAGGAAWQLVRDVAGEGLRGTRLPELVAACAAYKVATCELDPTDVSGVRERLNLGHTVAHAIEAATGGGVSHGQAVALGMHAILLASVAGSGLDADVVTQYRDVCGAVGIPLTSPLDWDELEPFLVHDKKRTARGIDWVLLAAPGAPRTRQHIDTGVVAKAWLRHVHEGSEETAGRPGSNGGSKRRRPRVLVLFGVNLGDLGLRDPEQYGSETLGQLVTRIEDWATELGLEADCRQTDSLERFIASLREARHAHDAVLVNPGAWTHYERALHDALESLPVPRGEVHLSDIAAREEWRHESVIEPVVDFRVGGKGADGFREALDWVAKQVDSHAWKTR